MVERVIEFGDDSTSQDNKNIEKNVPHMILIFFHYCKVSWYQYILQVTLSIDFFVGVFLIIFLDYIISHANALSQ